MLSGVPREIKSKEYRVALTPASVRESAAHGHQILVEQNAGALHCTYHDQLHILAA